MKVLIVDDEQDTLEFLSYNLKQANFSVIKSSDGIDALNKIKSENPDIAILDIMMPGIDGIEVCQEVRDSGNNNIIIVILSARNENYTKIAAYKAGCNDFITKPINPKLLINKINGLLKIKFSSNDFKGFKKVNDFIIDFPSHTIKYMNKDILLPKKQFKIFCLLSSRPGKVFTRDEIYSNVWGLKVFVGSRTIDVHIRSIREALGPNSIITVKGVGYKVLPWIYKWLYNYFTIFTVKFSFLIIITSLKVDS